MKCGCVLLLLAACGTSELGTDGGTGPDAFDAGVADYGSRPRVDAGPVEETVRGQGILSPRGGRIVSADGRASIFVPRFALLTRAELSLVSTATPSAGAHGPTYCLGPPSLELAAPVTLRITLEPEDRVDGSPALLTAGLSKTATKPPSHWPVSVSPDGVDLVTLLDAPGCASVLTRECKPGPGEGCDAPERCVVDEDAPASAFCAVPCQNDTQCPGPLYCVRGGCALGVCTRDSDCPRQGELCRGGACAPEVPLHHCGTRLCTAPEVGCRSGELGCSLRDLDASEGFQRAREVPSAWDYGYRNNHSPTSFVPLLTPNEPGLPHIFSWGGGPGRVQVGLNIDEAPQPLSPVLTIRPGWIFSHAQLGTAQAYATVLRYHFPRPGQYAVRMRVHVPFREQNLRPSSFVKLVQLTGVDAVNVTGSGRVLDTPDLEDSYTSTISALATDQLDFEHQEATVGDEPNYVETLINVRYLGP